MLSVEICSKCKYYDDEDIPNLWCKKIQDFINGSEMSELADAGCKKIKAVIELEKIINDEQEREEAEDE